MSSSSRKRPANDPFSHQALIRLRHDMRLNQHAFWRRFGVTQSGGSRYESGRAVSPTLRLLLTLGTAPEEEAQALLKALRTPPIPILGEVARAHQRLTPKPARPERLALGALPVLAAEQAIVLRVGEHELRLDADGALTLDGRPVMLGAEVSAEVAREPAREPQRQAG